jgi:hypothetical protein
MARIEIDPNYSSPTFSRATAAADIFKKEDVQALAAAMSTHVHDGAGKGLAIAATGIPAGSITSAMIADGTIATTDIAANACTQTGRAVGSTPGTATTSTSYADLTDMSVTLTTTGGDLLVWLTAVYAQQAGTPNDVLYMALSLDGAAEVGEVTGMSTAINVQFTLATVARFTGVAAGSHTIKGRWKVGTGTSSLAAIGGARRTLLVEELKK